MKFDWQSVIVALLVIGAIVYVGRLVIARIQSLSMSRGTSSACSTGCGSCAGSVNTPAPPVTTLVQIKRPAAASLPPDVVAVEQAIELVRQRKPREATALATSIDDQLMQKLVEWALLRQPESEVGFERYAAFIRTNPDWPSIPLFRRRAEVKLSQEQRDAVSARRSLGEEPASSVDYASRKPEVHAAQDADKRWRERRLLARKLIDLGDAKTAYRVVREAAPPANSYHRAEFHFMAGWIALRFLADPATALKHFGHVDDGSADPIVLEPELTVLPSEAERVLAFGCGAAGSGAGRPGEGGR